MESTLNTPVQPKSEGRLPKSLESLTSIETNSLVHDAIETQKKFLEWSNKAVNNPTSAPSIVDKFNESPSKKIMLTALSGVGLASVGLTLAAEKLGLSPIDTFIMWHANFGAPIIEELVFRSKKIPNFISLIGDKRGTPVCQDKARLATNALFAIGHINPFERVNENMIAVLNTFGAAGTLNKLSHERGMAASVALHAVWNATMIGSQYLIEGSRMYKKHGIGGDPLVRTLIRNDSWYNLVKKIYKVTQFAAMTGIGIIGIKEMLADKKLHELLERLRNTPNGNELVNFQEVTDMSRKLLASPSLDGYKFQAGVELGYVSAALSMPEALRDIMNPDQYARSQVHKTITDVWDDPKSLPRRLEKANTYITGQIASRATIGASQ